MWPECDAMVMASDEPSVTAIADLCSANGFEFDTLEYVKEDVYCGTLTAKTIGNSHTAYVKLLPAERRDNLYEFARLAPSVGHPECHVVDGDRVGLIMGKASGRPLSRLLPIVFVPGIWNLYREKIVRAYYQTGSYLGRLHSETTRGRGPTLRDSSIQKTIDRLSLARGALSDGTIAEIERLVNAAAHIETPYAITYGDRSPHNIYFNGKSATHIDCTCSRRSIVRDHATALWGLRLMVNRLPYARATIQSTLESAYWKGYSATGLDESVPDESIGVRHVATGLSLLATYNQPSSLRNRMVSHLDRPIILNEIRRTIDSVG